MGLLSATSNLWRAHAPRPLPTRATLVSFGLFKEVAKKVLRPVGLDTAAARAWTRMKSAFPLGRPIRVERKEPSKASLLRRSVTRLRAVQPIATTRGCLRRAVHATRAFGSRFFVLPTYRFVQRHFFTLVYPLNVLLSLWYRRRAHENSVLHMSYMVHIPWYATRIQRVNGMHADYLSVGGESPWWKKFDFHFPRDWPPLFWQEFVFFWRVIAKYEVIHSHFGIMLSQSGWEVPHLKRMGRKIVVHYRGCEARDPELNQRLHPESNICEDCDYDGSVCRDGRQRLASAQQNGDAFLVTTPDMLDFQKDALHFPFFTPAIDHEQFRARHATPDNGRSFRIVHATNHPGIEGTERIRSAIESLRKRGYAIDFEFLKGATPEQVLRAISAADLTIGKMKMGYYANAQIESMFLGVPAITHVRDELMTPELERSGLIFSNLDRLADTIAHYIDHPDELAAKRRIARSSIVDLHDNDRLAARLRGIYERAKGHADGEAATAARPLRVLHIGNIANNAYYNAKLLRRAGVHADVLCYDNYWVMSSPQWEESDFDGAPRDQQLPDWSELGVGHADQPRWFAQAPLRLAIRYLLAKQRGQRELADRLWDEMAAERRRLSQPWRRRAFEVRRRIRGAFRRMFAFVRRAASSARIHNYEDGTKHRNATLDARIDELVAEFAKRFPQRSDRLERADLEPYREHAILLEELFEHYDVIQAYATDTVYPMLAERPYVAFEHGTLRDAPEWEWEFKGPFHANPIGRVTALSYALARHVFVTNADCLSSAERLGLESYSPIPHPVADDHVFRFDPRAREEIRRELGVSRVLFCPIRHDWIDKGTDRHIRAIPRLREFLGDDFKVCFTPWGREIERSRELIRELGVEDQVAWIGPFGRVQLVRWLSAADVVLDQLTYESFSGITPRALACGAPIVAAYSPDSMRWMFPDAAPILAAKTTDEIVQQVRTACEPGFLEQHRDAARRWIETWHGSDGITQQLLDAYGASLPDAPIETAQRPAGLRRAD